MANLEASEAIEILTLEELMKLESLKGVDPNTVFGMDMEENFENLPPHARTYEAMGSAISGQSLDNWGRYGMHGDRVREFSNFGTLTEGLSEEGRLRMVVILQKYQRDLEAASFEYIASPIESETLDSAQKWLSDMLRALMKN